MKIIKGFKILHMGGLCPWKVKTEAIIRMFKIATGIKVIHPGAG